MPPIAWNNLDPEPIALFAAKAAVVFGGLIGLIAVISPRAFRQLALFGGTWFDTKATFEQLDRPIFVLSNLKNTRVFGFLVMAGAALLVILTPAAASWAWIGWAAAAVLAVIAAVALVCPVCFRSIAGIADMWVDTSRCFSVLDRQVDVDTAIVRHSRIFGGAVLAAAAAIALVFYL